ncbi:hypothetical protein SCALM49S_07006 [Streptomyces californicus]
MTILTNKADKVDRLAQLTQSTESVSGSSLWREAFRRMRSSKMAIIGAAIIAAFVLVAVVGPMLAPHGATAQNWRSEVFPNQGKFVGMRGENWFGLDHLGRDMFSRWLVGARQTLLVGVVSMLIGLVVGALVGVLSGAAATLGGKAGQRVDTVIMRFTDIMLSLPSLLLAVSIAAVLGQSLTTVMIAVRVVQIPTGAGPDHLRRAGLGAGRLGPGAGDQPAGGAPGVPRPHLSGHRARPRRRPAHSDVIGAMYLGGLVEEAPSDALYAKPRHPYTKALMSAVPVPDPEVEDRRERILLHGDLPSPANPPAGCRFHTRCPWVQETKCATERPPLLDTGGGHKVACHFTAEIEAGTVKQTLATGIEAVIATEAVAAEAVETSEGEAPEDGSGTGAKEPATVPAQEPATVPAQAGPEADAKETGKKAPDATEKAEGGPTA